MNIIIYFSMKTIITDINEFESIISVDKNDKVIFARDCKNKCIGCFSCWIKHPKKCIYKDEFSDITESLKNSDELIIISKNRYGCYSETVKRVFERCIGYVLPYFTIRNKHIHHASRYKNKLKLSTYFYGDVTNEDISCINALVKANSINLNATEYKVEVIDNVHSN